MFGREGSCSSRSRARAVKMRLVENVILLSAIYVFQPLQHSLAASNRKSETSMRNNARTENEDVEITRIHAKAHFPGCLTSKTFSLVVVRPFYAFVWRI